MALTPPLYCATCAAPCFLPRQLVPRPATLNSSISETVTNASYEVSRNDDEQGQGWLHEWHVLQVATGIQYSPLIDHALSASTSKPNNPRSILIHDYCLSAVLRTIIPGRSSSGFSHQETKMILWSLPKWTGYGPWIREPDRDGPGFLKDMETRGIGCGFWTGCADQKSRWREGVEGSHLLSVWSISP